MQGDFDVRIPVTGSGDAWDGLAAGINITAEELGVRTRESEDQRRFLRALVESAAEILIVHDLEGRILDANDYAAAELGYSKGELLGLTVGDIETREGPRAAWRDLVPGKPTTGLAVLRRKDGSTHPVEVRLSAFDAGPRRLVLSLARDLGPRSSRDASRRRVVEGIVRAQEEERRRVSRELHDAVGQLLTALSVEVRALESRPEAVPVRDDLRRLRQLTETAIAETSQLAHRLRPPALDDLGFVAALEGFVRSFSRVHGVETDVFVRGMSEGSRLSPAIETALYRAAQEALTNVARHAAAVTASIVLDRGPDRVRMIVEDDGRGFELDLETGLAKDGGGLGLAGMRERAQLLGGEVRIETRPGAGTTLSFTLPLETEEE